MLRKHAPRHTTRAIGGLPFQGKHAGRKSAIASIALLAASLVIARLQRHDPTPAPVIFFCAGWLVLYLWAVSLAGCKQCRADGLKCKAGGPRWVSAALLAIAMTATASFAVASTTVGERPAMAVSVTASSVLGDGPAGFFTAIRHWFDDQKVTAK